MLFSTIGQFDVFLWMLAAGAVIGAWYACTTAARRLLDAGVCLSLLADVAFGVGAAAIYCAALYACDHGRFRLYGVLAALAGFALFTAGVVPPAKRAARAIVRGISHIFVKISALRWIKVIFR